MTLIVVGVLLIGTAVLLGSLVGRSSLTAAQVGDCIQLSDKGSGSRKSCADPAANYVVLGATDSVRACGSVVGATATIVPGKERTLCLGAKGADLSRAVNGAKVDDCLVVRGDDAYKAPCAAGARKVLKIFRDELKAANPESSLAYKCADLDAADYVYAWSLDSGDQPAYLGSYDFIFCLGAELKK